MMRLGLSGKFWLIVLLALGTCLGLGVFAWKARVAQFTELAQLSREAIHDASVQSERRRGVALANMVADAAINPVYYFDLASLGETVRLAMEQPDIAYVLIYDAAGRIVQDGSADIARFGQPMDDPFAAAAVAATRTHVQISDELIDVAVPLMLGTERLGGVRVGVSLEEPAQFEREVSASVLGQLQDIRRSAVVLLSGFGALLVGMALIAAALLSGHVLRPVKRLAAQALLLERGDYGVEPVVSGRRDEVGDLEVAFARMHQSVSRQDREIRRIAYQDNLTGLHNRAGFRDLLDVRVGEAAELRKPLVLLFLDLDDFKKINDSLGHDAGDLALRTFGERVSEAARQAGKNRIDVGRFGGDEFVAIVSGTNAREVAERFARNVLERLKAPIELPQRDIMLAVSIGITVYPDDAESPAVLLKNADMAMYRAKIDGKNCYRFYSRDMDVAVEQRIDIEHELRRAIEREEFVVMYQPIHRLSDGVVAGAEALVRWQHPQRGMIPPDVFIGVAEQSDLINALGRLVLRRACKEAQRWRHLPNPPFISVNLSARQLRNGELPGIVAAELAASGLEPHRLHLELTETAMFGNEGDAVATLVRLRSLGVKILLDDFGTGFSGLSHLRRVTVDGVKIDRSFVAGMLEDQGDLALTSAVVVLGQSLGITVIAEGVETASQMEALRDRGCDYGQGYLFGKAMTGEALEKLLSGAPKGAG